MGRHHDNECSPNCGQVVIQNQGGSVVININCCSGDTPFAIAKQEQ
jgi:hypothetical protein